MSTVLLSEFSSFGHVYHTLSCEVLFVSYQNQGSFLPRVLSRFVDPVLSMSERFEAIILRKVVYLVMS